MLSFYRIYIAFSLWGASPVSYEIAKGYVKLGHSVSVVTMHYKGLPFEEKEGIKIYRVKCLRSKKEICHKPHTKSDFYICAAIS